MGKPWGIMRTHTKFFPAEHHAQSVIEAALQIRKTLFLSRNGRGIKGEGITSIVIHTFSVALQIIGSEKEKWMPTTRETADHSMPYLTAVALLDGNVTLAQYAKKRFMDSDVRSLLQKTRVKHAVRYSRRYPWDMPTKLEIELVGGQVLSAEVIKPKGYAGRPMSKSDVEEKFNRLATLLGKPARKRLINAVWKIDRMKNLKKLRSLMSTGKP